MKYFDFGTSEDTREMFHDIVGEYKQQFEMAKEFLPQELTEAQKFIGYLLIVNIHAICCLADIKPDDDGEGWKGE